MCLDIQIYACDICDEQDAVKLETELAEGESNEWRERLAEKMILMLHVPLKGSMV